MSYTPEATAPSSLEQNEQQGAIYASLAHLAAFGGLFVPLGHILGPLVVWLIKKHESPLVDDQGREALSFQISMTLYFVFFFLCFFVLFFGFGEFFIGFPFFGLGLLLLGALAALADAILVIVAAVRSREGKPYRYPLTLRLIPPAPSRALGSAGEDNE